MEKIIITGGTGLVGTALRRALLEKGYGVTILTRELPAQRDPASLLQFALWNVEKQTIDTGAIASADHIIHLAGENLAGKRWTSKMKRRIVDSRINSSKLLVNSLKSIPNKIKTVVSTSAIGWYGADRLIPCPSPLGGEGRRMRPFTESDPPASDFLGDTCKQWEESIDPVTELGKRLVKIRVGIVLSENGGALKEFIRPVKWGIAAILGSGKQVMSWIHIDDLVKIYLAAIENSTMLGVYNAVAPHPVTNKELVLTLAKSHKKFYVPAHIPSFVLKAILGEMSIEVLKSTTVSCSKIINTGFVFRFPSIDEALRK